MFFNCLYIYTETVHLPPIIKETIIPVTVEEIQPELIREIEETEIVRKITQETASKSAVPKIIVQTKDETELPTTVVGPTYVPHLIVQKKLVWTNMLILLSCNCSSRESACLSIQVKDLTLYSEGAINESKTIQAAAQSSVTVAAPEHIVIQKEPIIHEVVTKKIIEQEQPEILQKTYETTIIKETVPLKEKVVQAPDVHLERK